MRLDQMLEGIPYQYANDKRTLFIEEIVSDENLVQWGSCFVLLCKDSLTAKRKLIKAHSSGAAVLLLSCKMQSQLGEWLDTLTCTVVVVQTLSPEVIAEILNHLYPDLLRRLIMVGVTGTKGKTSVCQMVYQVLSEHGKKCGMIGTLGVAYSDQDKKIRIHNTTPDLITIYYCARKMLQEGCRYLIMEVSSQALKMGRVYGICFDLAVFMNLYPDHIGPREHPDLQDYIRCKKKLFSQCRFAVINQGDVVGREILHEIKCPAVTFGRNRQADFQIKDKSNTFLAENQMAADIVLRFLTIPEKGLTNSIRHISIPGRMERVSGIKGEIIIDYAHNEDSMRKVIMAVRPLCKGRIMVVFGCGGNRSRTRRLGMGKVASELADVVILTEDNSRWEPLSNILSDILEGMGDAAKKAIVIPDRKEAVFYALDNKKMNDILLLLGKGQEEYIEKNGVRIPFSEKKVLEEYAQMQMEKMNDTN